MIRFNNSGFILYIAMLAKTIINRATGWGVTPLSVLKVRNVKYFKYRAIIPGCHVYLI